MHTLLAMDEDADDGLDSCSFCSDNVGHLPASIGLVMNTNQNATAFNEQSHETFDNTVWTHNMCFMCWKVIAIDVQDCPFSLANWTLFAANSRPASNWPAQGAKLQAKTPSSSKKTS